MVNKLSLTCVLFLFVLLHSLGNVFAQPLAVDQAREQYSQTAFHVVNVSEVTYEDAPAIGIVFSVPVSEGFHRYLNVAIKNGEQLDGGWILSEAGTTAYFTHIDAQTEYVVSIYRGLSSITDKQLKQTEQRAVRTRAVKSSVAFASSGYVLPQNGSQGLPLYTVNVEAVDVDFHRVKQNKISEFLTQWYPRQSQYSWRLERYAPYIELKHSGRFELAPPKNKRHLTHLPVKQIAALREPGVYVAVMKPAGQYPHNYQVTYFVVSDIGLHARFYHQRVDVYSHSLESALPLQRTKMTVLDRQGRVVAQATSSPEGLVTFQNLNANAYLLFAQNGKQITLLKMKNPALDLSAFEVGKREQLATQAFIYGPRDLYRPGETVIFNALLRDGDGVLVSNVPLQAVIRSADQREVHNTTWHGNELAYYYQEFVLPARAPTGTWRLRLKIGSKVIGEYAFKVEEFLPERMKLTLDDGVERQRFISADENSALSISVKGDYLYGAPAAKNRLSSLFVISQERHPVKAHQGFYFGDIQEHASPQRHELKDMHLDDHGVGEISIENTWSTSRSPLNIQVAASLYESGGRAVVRDIHYTLWPQRTMLGIRPLFEEGELPGNALAGFEVIHSDREGKLYSAKNLEVKLVREHKNYFWVYSEGRGWHYQYTQDHYTALTKSLDIDGQQVAKIEVPVEWGEYRLEVRDPQTNLISSVRFRSGWGYVEHEGNDTRPDRVEITLDKKSYHQGDVAKVTLRAPYAGQGMVLVEGDEPLFWKEVNVPESGVTLEVPIEAHWNHHNLYVSAVVFRSGKSETRRMPKRSVGLLHLPLNRDERKLDVSVITPSDKVMPETTLRATVRVKGVKTSQQPVMVSLAAVDVGVLNITDFETPDAHEWFFEPRRYSVDMRDMYAELIESLDGDMAKQRFGGDADLSRGGKQAQSDVQIVSLFQRAVTLNENGEADIELDLPDFNGRLRLMALAFGDSSFGSAEHEITVASPVIAELSLPRFLANGDQSMIALDVHNLSEEERELALDVTATAPLIMEHETQKIILAAGEKQIFHFNVQAQEILGQGKINVLVRSVDDVNEPIRIQRQWRINVRPAYPAVTRTIRTVLNQSEKLTLTDETDDLMPSTIEAELKVSPQPPINLNNHFKHLLRYPYGCLEQTTSSTYPWLFATQENIEKLDLHSVNQAGVKLEKRLSYIEKGLQRIQTLQSVNGGFGLWHSTSEEQHWLTAYVADFITDARALGISVDDVMFRPMMNRLLQYVNASNGMFAERWSDNASHYRLAYRAYAAYVLSKSNRAPLGSLRNMYDQHRQAAMTGLPLVHLGIALLNQGDQRRGVQAIEDAVRMTTQKKVDRYYADYGSTVRDLALMVYLLEKHNVDVSGRSVLLFTLSDELSTRTHLSTQERFALFKAGVALSTSTLEKGVWAGILDSTKDKKQLLVQGEYQQAFTGHDLEGGFQFTSEHEQSLFAELNITGYTKATPAAVQDDIIVERDYYDIHGNLLSTVDEQGVRQLPSLATGDIVVVHLRVGAKRRIPDALLVDLLPAGLELENQNLQHALKLDNFFIDGKPYQALQQHTDVRHQEYRDDRYVAALSLNEWQSSHLFYLVRVVTPGDYRVPSVYVEDMYRPFIYGISQRFGDVTVVNKEVE